MHDKNFMFLLASLIAALTQQGVAQPQTRKLYLLEDVKHQQWCAFGKKNCLAR
jgi:hypothetical protein